MKIGSIVKLQKHPNKLHVVHEFNLANDYIDVIDMQTGVIHKTLRNSVVQFGNCTIFNLIEILAKKE